ncbi:uncharacterized protein LOC114538109 [Dendronephthya gigantea]|nr:uncharacterized protein LOC114538109 [Dendronephthya gigantea]
MSKFIVRLGEFHSCMSYATAIACRFRDAGLQDIFIESEIVAQGSLNGVFSGKHYNRCIRAHKLVFEAMERLRFEAFLDSQTTLQKSEIIGLVKEISGNLNKEHFDAYVENVTIQEIGERFQQFIENESQRSATFQLWSSYIDMVYLLLTFIRATRTSDWMLHLSTIRAMLPWYFAYDRINYARYMSTYWLEMICLDDTHPGASAELSSKWTVQRQQNYGFSAIACDQAIEQTCNRDSKTKGGIVGLTQNRAAINRWILAQADRSAITRKCELMAGVAEEQRMRKDLDNTHSSNHEESVKQVISTVSSMSNPFSPDSPKELVNICSGVVADEVTTADVKNAYNKGDQKLEDFLHNRLLCEEPDIFSNIGTMKLKTFKSMSKSKKVKTSSGSTVTVKNDARFWARLLVIAKNRDIDLENVFTYSLRAYPRALATDYGGLVKTSKSKLLHTLEKEAGEPLIEQIPQNSATIIDGMALLQALKTKDIPENFGQLAELLLKKIIAIAVFNKSQRVDFVTDRYPEISTKNVERTSRAASGTNVFSILSEQQRIPRQWKKFMNVGSNKERLIDFLVEEWKKAPLSRLGSVEFFVTKQEKCIKIHSAGDAGVVVAEEISELECDHEEADTRMFVHAHHAAESVDTVVIKSPDTDVFVIAIASQPTIDAKLIFDTGTGNNQRRIDINEVAAYFGTLWCKAIIGFHIFTGSDSTSAFFGKGKVRAFKVARNSVEFSEAFATLGEDVNIPENLGKILEKYVCYLYGQDKAKSINDARYTMFKFGKCTEESLPPNSDSLHQHILRANFESYVRKHATIPILASPSPVGYGWKLEEGELQIVWGTQPPAPESILEYVDCKCKKGCTTNRCSCHKSGLKCTELCQCNGCENYESAEELSELEAQFLEYEYGEEGDDYDD